jgi:hypothetical protein
VTTEAEKAAEKERQAQAIRERRVLSDAYAALLGQASVQSWLAFTFEEAVDLQIESIEGSSSTKRPNELERVDRIEQSTTSAITQLKNTPPEEFVESDSDEDVNTEE